MECGQDLARRYGLCVVAAAQEDDPKKKKKEVCAGEVKADNIGTYLLLCLLPTRIMMLSVSVVDAQGYYVLSDQDHLLRCEINSAAAAVAAGPRNPR